MKPFTTALNKAIPFLLLMSVFFVSCKKDAVVSPAIIDSHITAVYTQDDHYLRIDSLVYDVNGRIAKILETTTDTATGVIGGLKDSSSFIFTFSGTSSVPTFYAVSYNGFSGTGAEQHNLYYDSQNRMTKDSLLNASIGDRTAYNYYYGNNQIAYAAFSKTDSGIVITDRDTVFLNASGNIIADNSYSYYLDYNNNFQLATDTDMVTYTFSSYVNPLYEKNVAGSLGPLLSGLLSHDFISPNLFSVYSYYRSYYTSHTTEQVPYTWTTDSKGRVIKGVEPSGQSGFAFHYNN